MVTRLAARERARRSEEAGRRRRDAGGDHPRLEEKFGCAPTGDRCPDMSIVNR
jgi:hypothetical protein